MLKLLIFFLRVSQKLKKIADVVVPCEMKQQEMALIAGRVTLR
jgi:hypothetical protein